MATEGTDWELKYRFLKLTARRAVRDYTILQQKYHQNLKHGEFIVRRLEQREKEIKEVAKASSGVYVEYNELDQLYQEEKQGHEATSQMLSKYYEENQKLKRKNESLRKNTPQVYDTVEDEEDYDELVEQDNSIVELLQKIQELREENASVRGELQLEINERDKYMRRSEELQEKLKEEKKQLEESRKMVVAYSSAVQDCYNVYEELAKEDEENLDESELSQQGNTYEAVSDYVSSAEYLAQIETLRGQLQEQSQLIAMLEDENKALKAEATELRDKLAICNAPPPPPPPPILEASKLKRQMFKKSKLSKKTSNPPAQPPETAQPGTVQAERPKDELHRPSVQNQLNEEMKRKLEERCRKPLQPYQSRQREFQRKASVKVLRDVLGKLKPTSAKSPKSPNPNE